MAKNVNLAKVCNIKGVNKVLGMDAAGSAMRVCDGGSAQAPAKKKERAQSTACWTDSSASNWKR